MRHASRRLAVLAITPVALVLPVVSRPAPRAHAVAPHVHEHAVRGALTSATSSEPFQTLGVTWADGSGDDVTVVVRVRQHGTWTPWHALDADGDHGPDATGPDTGVRAGTTEWFTGPSDGYQVRVTSHGGRPPRDVRVALVDPGTSAADATLGTATTLASAEASTGQPAIVTRAQWGADESIRRGHPDYSDTIKMGFVHHTDTSNAYSPAQAASMVRGVYAYHVLSRGWSDIGYNFLVDKYGRIFEGRYGGVSRPVIGAHTGGFNTDTFGVSLLGTYTSVAPTAAELGALERVFAWKLGLHYVDPLGRSTLTSRGGTKYASGTSVTFDNIAGHRDAGLTSCPGALVYNQLAGIRNAVKYDMGASLYGPTVSTTSPVYRTTPNVTVRAGVARAQSWRLTVRQPVSGLTVRTLNGTASSSLAAAWNLRDAHGLYVVPDQYDLTLSSWTSSSTARPYTVRVLVKSPLPGGVAISRPDGAPYAIVAANRRLGVTAALGRAVRPQPVVAYYGSVALLSAPSAPPRDGMYLRSATSGATYVVVDGARRRIASDVAAALGLAAPRVVPDAVLALVPAGPAWTDATRHPDGSVVTTATGGWRLESGVLRPFTSPAARSAWSKAVSVGTATSADLGRMVGAPLPPPEGVLLRTATGAGVVGDGTFRPLTDAAALGYDAAAAPLATADDLAALPAGPAVGTDRHPSGTLLRNGSTYVEVLGTWQRAVDPSLVAADPRVPVAARTGEVAALGGARWVPPSGLAGVGADGTVRVVDSGRLVTLQTAAAQALRYTGLPALEAADFGPLPVGTLNDATAHPAGTVVTDGVTSWLLDAGMRRPLAASLVPTWLGRPPLPATPADLAKPVGPAAPPGDGAWLRTPDGTRWLVDGGVRRAVTATAASRLGLDAIVPVDVDGTDLAAATMAGSPVT